MVYFILSEFSICNSEREVCLFEILLKLKTIHTTHIPVYHIFEKLLFIHLLNQNTVNTNPLLLQTTANQGNRQQASQASQTTLNIKEKTSLFGISLLVFGDTTVALILLSVALLGFILIGLVEERFKFVCPDFQFGWTLTAIELYIFSFFATIETMLKEASILFFNDSNNTNNKRNSLLATSKTNVNDISNGNETSNSNNNNNNTNSN